MKVRGFLWEGCHFLGFALVQVLRCPGRNVVPAQKLLFGGAGQQQLIADWCWWTLCTVGVEACTTMLEAVLLCWMKTWRVPNPELCFCEQPAWTGISKVMHRSFTPCLCNSTVSACQMRHCLWWWHTTVRMGCTGRVHLYGISAVNVARQNFHWEIWSQKHSVQHSLELQWEQDHQLKTFLRMTCCLPNRVFYFLFESDLNQHVSEKWDYIS